MADAMILVLSADSRTDKNIIVYCIFLSLNVLANMDKCRRSFSNLRLSLETSLRVKNHDKNYLEKKIELTESELTRALSLINESMRTELQKRRINKYRARS